METPPPVDRVGQQNPDWFSEGACEVGDSGVDGDDEVEARYDSGKLSEVGKTGAVVDEVDRACGGVDSGGDHLERGEANAFYRGKRRPVGEGNRPKTIAFVAGVSRPGKAYVEGVVRHGGGCRDVEWDRRWDVVEADQVWQAHQRGMSIEVWSRRVQCCGDETLADVGRALEEGMEGGGDFEQDSSSGVLGGQGDEAKELKGVPVTLLAVEQEGAIDERLSVPAWLGEAVMEGVEARDLEAVLEFLPAGTIAAMQKKGKAEVPVGFFVCGVFRKEFFERGDATGVAAQGKQICKVFADRPCWVKSRRSAI